MVGQCLGHNLSNASSPSDVSVMSKDALHSGKGTLQTLEDVLMPQSTKILKYKIHQKDIVQGAITFIFMCHQLQGRNVGKPATKLELQRLWTTVKTPTN